MGAVRVTRLGGRWCQWLALVALTYAALAVGAPSAFAATSTTAYDTFGVDSPDSQAKQHFGERLADADLGDGARDVFVSSYRATVGGATFAGEVTLINGRDRSIRYELNSPEVQQNAQFGFYISVIGDVNGNGKDDLAVGAPYENVDAAGNACAVGVAGCNANQGKVFVFEGSSGRLLYEINNPQPQADEGVFGTFGARIGPAGDVNGDGIPDIIVGSPSNDVLAGCGVVNRIPAGCRKNEGEAFIFSGKDGSLIRPLSIPPSDKADPSCTTTSTTSRCGNFGGTVQTLGDVNGDGVSDQFVAAYSLRPTPDRFGRVYVFSGRDGSLLTRIDAPEPGSGQFFGLQDGAPNTPGDVNGDGVADIYVDAFNQAGSAGPGQGKAWVFDGKASVAAGTGVLLYEVNDPAPAPAKSFGFSVSRTDYNKDGTPDLLVGGLGGPNHEVYIADGKNGSPLRTLAMPEAEVQPNVPGNAGSGLGGSSRAVGDLNGDGEPDYVASAPTEDVGGNQDQGRVYFFLSNVPTTPPGGGASSGGGGLTSSGSMGTAPSACSLPPLVGREGPILTSAVNNTARQVSRSRSRNLLQHRGFSMSFNAIRPGTAFIALKGPHQVTMAFARHTFTKANRLTIKVNLTKKGRQLLRKLRRGHPAIKVRLTIKYDTHCSYAPTRSKSVHIKR